MKFKRLYQTLAMAAAVFAVQPAYAQNMSFDSYVQLLMAKARAQGVSCLLYTSPSPRDATLSRMPSSA